MVLRPFFTAFYNLIALTGLFPEMEAEERRGPRHHLDRENNAAPAASVQSPLLKDKPDAVQERRRARALKLLDAKMAELNATAGADDGEDEGWGDGDDEPSNA